MFLRVESEWFISFQFHTALVSCSMKRIWKPTKNNLNNVRRNAYRFCFECFAQIWGLNIYVTDYQNIFSTSLSFRNRKYCLFSKWSAMTHKYYVARIDPFVSPPISYLHRPLSFLLNHCENSDNSQTGSKISFHRNWDVGLTVRVSTKTWAKQ